jgi:hypothetical protein
MNRLLIFILAFICVLGFLARFIARIQKEQTDLIARYLSVHQQSIGFNGTVMIARKGSRNYRWSVGKASLELDVAFSSDPVFRVQVEFEKGSDSTIEDLKAKLKGQLIHFVENR